jgi:L-glutamine-phosphate cytidylyltransferase
MSFKKAVIVAAGKSSRLYPLTLDTPKGLLDIGGEKLLERSIRLLKEQGVEEILVVTGFQRKKMEEALAQPGVNFLFNPFFAETNNLGSLWMAKQWVGSDSFFYLHSDLIYHSGFLELLKSDDMAEESRLLVDFGPVDEEAMKVRLKNDYLLESNKQIPLDEAAGEWVGIASFIAKDAPVLFETLEEVLEERMFQSYDTEAFTRLAKREGARGVRFKAIATAGLPWFEIDFLEDLEKAKIKMLSGEF